MGISIDTIKNMIWRRTTNWFSTSTPVYTNKYLTDNFCISSYVCPVCHSHLYMTIFPIDAEMKFLDSSHRPHPMDCLYTCQTCSKFYASSEGKKLSMFNAYYLYGKGNYEEILAYYDNIGTTGGQQNLRTTIEDKPVISFDTSNNNKRAIVKVPFDTRYDPDLIFATDKKLSDRFPNDAGKGKLNLMFPERTFSKFANLAHTAMIIDNYLVQFGESGNMYILDIVNNTFDTIPIANTDSLPSDLTQWIKSAGTTAVKMMNAVENNEQAQIWLKLYWTVLCYNTTSTVSKKDYEFAMEQMRMGFGLSANSNTMCIRNRKWYYDSKEMNWGNVAFSIFKSYFESFNNYNRI